MDWNKQAETMFQTWTEAQKQMWEGWFNMVQPSSAMDNSPFPFYPEMLKQWQNTALQSFNTWSSSTVDPTAQGVMQQMMAAQSGMMRFLHTLSQTWQAIVPKVEAGEDWRTVLNEYSSQFFQTMMGAPTGFMTAGKDMNELWQFYIQEWQKMTQPWMQTLMQSPGNMSQVFMGGSSALGQLTEFHWDVYERTFGGITEVPGIGSNRELNQKLLRAFDSWVDLQKVIAEYQASLSNTMSRAYERFFEKLVAMSEKGEKIETVQDLMNLWFDTVDETFIRVYESEDYLEVQKNLAAAAMKQKMAQQEIFEVFLNMLDLPTRSELDEAYQSLNQLRREVKTLKKALKEQSSASTAKPAAKKSSRSSSAKRKSTSSSSTDSNGKVAEASSEPVSSES